MRRFFVDRIGTENGTLTITGPEARHIARVLRMKRGDRFVLMDGKGARFQARIESMGRRDVLVTLEKPLPLPSASPADITLCQALLRSHAMDYVIQKASELGVRRVLPFTSERTLIRLDRERLGARQRHWQEVARSAAKQSGRAEPAAVGPLFDLHGLMEEGRGEKALKVVLWEGERSQDLKSLLKASSPERAFWGIVGPEGGFSREEIERIETAGFVSGSLGNRILRAETAALTVAAVVQYEWGDLSLSPAEG